VGGVVVCEFRGREKLFPVVLLVVAEDAQVLLENLVDALGLAVSLRMKGRRHVGLDVGESEKVPPEPRGENLVAIGHDVGREAVESADVPEEEASDLWGVGSGLGGREVRHLGEAIDHDEDGVATRGRDGQADNEVHGNGFPGARGHWERNEVAVRLWRGALARAQVSHVET